MKSISAALFFLLVIASCKDRSSNKDKIPAMPPADSLVVADTIANKDSVLRQLTTEVMTLLKNKDYAALAPYIDSAGIRFSPYGFIDTASDLLLSRDKFLEEAIRKPQRKLAWGEFDGTGDPIRLTVNEYMKRFVYDVDFAAPDSLAVNRYIGGGNTMNNLSTVYEGCDFSESHFPGFKKELDGMDWRSLRLVFKVINGKYYMVAIVHDEWTI